MNDEILTATYTAAFKRVRIVFVMSGEHQFTMCGDVSDDELATLIAAEGASVPGWSVDFN